MRSWLKINKNLLYISNKAQDKTAYTINMAQVKPQFEVINILIVLYPTRPINPKQQLT